MQQNRPSSQPILNCYEQLGLSRSASNQEIRQAFDALSRVYRAGQHSSEDLNTLARLQLQRVSQLVDMLTDPDRRYEYDLSLDGAELMVLPDASAGFTGARMRTVAYVLMVLALPASAMLWRRSWTSAPAPAPALHTSLKAEIRPEPRPKAIASHAGVVPTVRRAPLAPQPAMPPAPEPQAEAARPSDPDPVAPPASYTLAKVLNESSIAAPLPENMPAPPSEPRPAARPSFAGKWLYASRSEDVGKGLYAPLFIELVIDERAGKIQGKYSAKYEVLDRPMSPDVNFRFEGLPSADPEPAFGWFYSDGSKGELRFKRLTGESMEVSWITTVFGKAGRLASGKAILYRAE